MLRRILRFRRWKTGFSILIVYGAVSITYYLLPWKVREPVYRRVPKIDRALQRSGFRIFQGWDGLALFGRDAQAELERKGRGDHVYGGYPSQGFQFWGKAERLDNRGYTVGYSESMRNPLWSAYRVFDVPRLSSGKRPSGFPSDARTRAKVVQGDYTHSGFDRGHMAPNYAIATRYGEQAQKETFLMSNIIPQTPYVNRGMWKDLEMHVAKRYGRYFGEVWVICGPVFEKTVEKLDSGVPVPSHYYKIIADEHDGRLRVLAFLVEKRCPPYTRIKKRLVSIDEIEQRTGLDFFPELPERMQQELEAEPASRLWPWMVSAVRYYFGGRLNPEAP
ncbi:DNA/RNA non-specific endonuclease [Pontiella sulfatireligans]|uniref:Nuclease n=1 Tax=Pontiella sulfatireligans TaxID=2750658 RepID=A0A6C2UQH9_9BACT|nr:DNA/RNA non-specific endonuclease [Pontiella sulfatireligans]VGO21557.1 Nuclease [Pontiella sulfatireligans]